MTRVNVYRYPSDDDYEGETELAGHFDIDKADRFDEDTRWDGNNHISTATGSQWDHQVLYRTAQGRWVLHHWSQWQGTQPRYEYIESDQAREWLLAQNRDDAVEKHFGEIEEERGPGQPPIGDRLAVRLPDDVRAKLRARAARLGTSEAGAARAILAEHLTD